MGALYRAHGIAHAAERTLFTGTDGTDAAQAETSVKAVALGRKCKFLVASEAKYIGRPLTLRNSCRLWQKLQQHA